MSNNVNIKLCIRLILNTSFEKKIDKNQGKLTENTRLIDNVLKIWKKFTLHVKTHTNIFCILKIIIIAVITIHSNNIWMFI